MEYCGFGSNLLKYFQSGTAIALAKPHHIFNPLIYPIDTKEISNACWLLTEPSALIICSSIPFLRKLFPSPRPCAVNFMTSEVELVSQQRRWCACENKSNHTDTDRWISEQESQATNNNGRPTLAVVTDGVDKHTPSSPKDMNEGKGENIAQIVRVATIHVYENRDS